MSATDFTHYCAVDSIETVIPTDELSVFETLPVPAVTFGDMADALDCPRETTRRKRRHL